MKEINRHLNELESRISTLEEELKKTRRYNQMMVVSVAHLLSLQPKDVADRALGWYNKYDDLHLNEVTDELRKALDHYRRKAR